MGWGLAPYFFRRGKIQGRSFARESSFIYSADATVATLNLPNILTFGLAPMRNDLLIFS